MHPHTIRLCQLATKFLLPDLAVFILDAEGDIKSSKIDCRARYEPMTVVAMALVVRRKSCRRTGLEASNTSTGSAPAASTSPKPSPAQKTSKIRGSADPVRIATRIAGRLKCSS